jgi:predicted MFS family arabinose efflux permease
MSTYSPSLSLGSIEDANYHHLVRDIVWFGLAFTATSRFLSVFALRLGADEALLGWITSLPALIVLVTAALAPAWRAHRSDSVHALMLPTFIFRLIFILPAFAPLMPPQWRMPWLLLSATLPGLGQGISGVVFITCMQESVSKGRLTGLYSRRSMMFNLSLAISALVFGAWLEFAPFPLNYQVMFVVAFICALVSQWHVSRLKPLYAPPPVQEQESKHLSPWKSPEFRKVAVILAVTFFSFHAVNALINARLVNELRASEGYMAIFGLIELLAGALASAFAIQIVKHIGFHRMIALSMGMTALSTLMLGISSNLMLGLFAAALTGAGWMLVAMVGIIGLYTESAPVDSATRYSVAYHQVAGVITFVAPFIGTWLVQADLSLSLILIIGAALRLGAGFAVGSMWWDTRRKLTPSPSAQG